nr:MAG TPA: hypothetical protein [Caudoviricetes sp.]
MLSSYNGFTNNISCFEFSFSCTNSITNAETSYFCFCLTCSPIIRSVSIKHNFRISFG